MNNCVDPLAKVETCVVCGSGVHTCERSVPVKGDYRCPAHPNGVEMSGGGWVCSEGCYEEYTGKYGQEWEGGENQYADE